MSEPDEKGRYLHGLVVKTERLVLRDYQESDAEAIFSHRSNANNLLHMYESEHFITPTLVESTV